MNNNISKFLLGVGLILAVTEGTGFGKGLYDPILRQLFGNSDFVMNWLNYQEKILPFYYPPSKNHIEKEALVAQKYKLTNETNPHVRTHHSDRFRERVHYKLWNEGKIVD